MTTSEPPLSAPSASSQALPADQAHPAVRAGQDAYMELLRTGDGCPGSHDVAAAVTPAVLRWAAEQIVAHHMSLSGYAISEHIDAWATEITRSAR